MGVGGSQYNTGGLFGVGGLAKTTSPILLGVSSYSRE